MSSLIPLALFYLRSEHDSPEALRCGCRQKREKVRERSWFHLLFVHHVVVGVVVAVQDSGESLSDNRRAKSVPQSFALGFGCNKGVRNDGIR